MTGLPVSFSSYVKKKKVEGEYRNYIQMYNEYSLLVYLK